MANVKAGVGWREFDPNNHDHLSHGLWAISTGGDSHSTFEPGQRGGSVTKFNNHGSPVKLWEYVGGTGWVVRAFKDPAKIDADVCENCGGPVKDTYSPISSRYYYRAHSGWTTHRRNGRLVYPLKCEFLCLPCSKLVSN